MVMAAKPNRNVKGPRMIKEIVRLHEAGLGTKKIAKALGISRNTVKSYLEKDTLSKLDATPGPIVTALIPAGLPTYVAPWSHLVDWSDVKSSVDKGVQLQHYWEENIFSSHNRDLRTVSKVTFWREFKRKFPSVPLHLHKEFPPGERCEADYKGEEKGFGYIDPASKKFVQCQLFGNILTFSQLAYFEATHTQQQEDFLNAFSNSFRNFGGVPHTSVVDNAKVGVSKAHRYDPDYHPEFTRFCEHYHTAHIAARPKSPKDKCFIENVLGVFWRWAGPKIRKQTFYSIGALNSFLMELQELFNNRIQKKYGQSRRQKFDTGEKEKLLPLPVAVYSAGTWKKHTPHPDSHVQVGYNFYSVPYQLRGREVDVRIAGGFIEVFHNLERVALHLMFQGCQRGHYQTKNDHLPPSHLAVKEFTPRRALQEAAAIGTETHKIIDNLLNKSSHPLLFLRRVQGILRLSKRYSSAALEHTCQKLNDVGINMPRLSDVEGIIKNNPCLYSRGEQPSITRGPNPNLRGQNSWESDVIGSDLG